MADNDNRSRNLMSSPSSEMHITTTNKSSNVVDSIFSNGWDPPSQAAEFKGSQNSIDISPFTSNPHILRYPLDPSFLEASPKLCSFGNGSFSAMVSSFGFPEYDQITNASCPDYTLSCEGGINHNPRKLDDQGVVDEGGSGSSPDSKKRKRAPQSGETGHKRNVSQESIEGITEHDGKKQKSGKQSSQNEESSKEDYIHVRARRGQATNSHSLAERVRREKISQRMKYLQDLVPGCDKITGKALMLDEIINYVQSLQRQVEFLSMKLSAVNPELNIDIDRIISKNILHSQALGFGSAISSSLSHPQPIPQMNTTWEDEFQNMIQMGLMSNPALESLGLNGKT